MNDDLSDTITPKSDQLNYDDLIGGPITVTVTAVKRGVEEQPVSVEITDHRPYKPCKSMRRVLITAWGAKGAAWVGRSMTLYGDPAVKFGGVEVGGIRISHLSHIDKPLTVKLTTTRAKRAPFIVEPLAVEESRADKCRAFLAAHGKQESRAVDLIGKALTDADPADFRRIAEWVADDRAARDGN